MAISDKSRSYFEGSGETAIRHQIERGTIYPYASVGEANEWLEEVFLRRSELASRPAIRIATSARTIAIVSMIAAVIAVPIAIAAIAISYLAWCYPHH